MSQRIRELEDVISFIYETLRPGLCPKAKSACMGCDFEVEQVLAMCRKVLGENANERG